MAASPNSKPFISIGIAYAIPQEIATLHQPKFCFYAKSAAI
jgi:hypothetical protein